MNTQEWDLKNLKGLMFSEFNTKFAELKKQNPQDFMKLYIRWSAVNDRKKTELKNAEVKKKSEAGQDEMVDVETYFNQTETVLVETKPLDERNKIKSLIWILNDGNWHTSAELTNTKLFGIDVRKYVTNTDRYLKKFNKGEILHDREGKLAKYKIKKYAAETIF